MLDTARWYVFQSHVGKEFLAQKQLSRLKQRFETFVPFEIKEKKRLGVVIGHEKRAIFRSYGFIRFDIDKDWWRPICSTYGVKRLFSTTPECPIPLPHDTIETLIKSFETVALAAPEIIPATPVVEQAIIAVPEVIAEHAPAVVLEGVFAGNVGICEYSDTEKTELLMQILGGDVKITFKTRDVAAKT